MSRNFSIEAILKSTSDGWLLGIGHWPQKTMFHIEKHAPFYKSKNNPFWMTDDHKNLMVLLQFNCARFENAAYLRFLFHLQFILHCQTRLLCKKKSAKPIRMSNLSSFLKCKLLHTWTENWELKKVQVRKRAQGPGNGRGRRERLPEVQSMQVSVIGTVRKMHPETK